MGRSVNSRRFWMGLALILMVAGHLIVDASITDAQVLESNLRKSDSTTPSRSVVKLNGWLLPKVKPTVGLRPEIIDLEGMAVGKRLLTHSNDPVDFEDFYVDPNGGVRISSEKCLLGAIISYEIKNKVFACQVTYNPVEVGNSGVVTRSGALIFVFFLDKDGDGLFEERVQSHKMPQIPDWAKSRATN